MNNPSDAEALHTQVLFLKIRAKSTEELISIWTENNQKAWSRDEFDVVQKVLLERLGKLPEQKITHEAKVVAAKKRGIETKPAYVSFHDLSPYNQFRAAIAVFCIIGLCFGAIVVKMVEENTNLFWRFAENSKVSDIEKMEVEGNTIFVGYLWAKPGVYSFGNGNAKFSAPDFYEWLAKNGLEIQE